MAAVAASHFATRTAGYGGALDSEPRTFQNQRIPRLRSHAVAFHGLRSSNALDLVRLPAAGKAARWSCARDDRRRSGTVVCWTGMNLVFVGAEMGPWSKTGGLGDVLGGLPPAMAAIGHRVMVITPRYDQYKDAWDTGVSVELQVGDKLETVRFFHCFKRGVDRVFVDHPMFLEKVWGKTGGKVYGPVTGIDYNDNQLRFSMLCLAALEAPRVLSLNNNKYYSGPYGEEVVFIANDWHTAPLSCYLKVYQSNGLYNSAKVAFCLHNIAYQGRFAFSDFALLNLPNRFKPSFEFMDGYDKPVKGKKINWMKAGIKESHLLLTVSPYYAIELVSGEDKGCELDDAIREAVIKGIVNGMDTNEWNPLTDKYITVNYDATTATYAKRANKEALQSEVGLTVNADTPLIIFVGRLEEQKGSDILAAAVPEIAGENVHIIILGTGKKKFEQQIGDLEEQYPDNVRGVAKFNVPLAHAMMAGGDFIIVTSRFEPCGLIQLQGMQYGTVPICASTGGLVDTVKEGVTGFHMGAFDVDCEVVDPEDVEKTVTTVQRALKEYGTPLFSEMIQNCMAQDLSWKGPAKKWEEVLLGLEVNGSAPGVDGVEIAPLAMANVATP